MASNENENEIQSEAEPENRNKNDDENALWPMGSGNRRYKKDLFQKEIFGDTFQVFGGQGVGVYYANILALTCGCKLILLSSQLVARSWELLAGSLEPGVKAAWLNNVAFI